MRRQVLPIKTLRRFGVLMAFVIGMIPGPAAAQSGGDAGCLACHGDAGKLIGMVSAPEAPPEDGCAAAPSRPPFLGYFVNADRKSQSKLITHLFVRVDVNPSGAFPVPLPHRPLSSS